LPPAPHIFLKSLGDYMPVH